MLSIRCHYLQAPLIHPVGIINLDDHPCINLAMPSIVVGFQFFIYSCKLHPNFMSIHYLEQHGRNILELDVPSLQTRMDGFETKRSHLWIHCCNSRLFLRIKSQHPTFKKHYLSQPSTIQKFIQLLANSLSIQSPSDR